MRTLRTTRWTPRFGDLAQIDYHKFIIPASSRDIVCINRMSIDIGYMLLERLQNLATHGTETFHHGHWRSQWGQNARLYPKYTKI